MAITTFLLNRSEDKLVLSRFGTLKGGTSRAFAAVCAGLLFATLLAAPSTSSAMAEAGGNMVDVIVRQLPGAVGLAHHAVHEADGRVLRPIEIIDGFTARVPSGSIPSLRNQPGVFSVDMDRAVHLNSMTDGYDATSDNGSMFHTAKSIKASEFWKAGFTGQGVGVALLDTGVVPVNGMTSTNNDGTPKVTHGPDLSLDNSTPEMRYLDGFGHGTHMAGIIAGKDDGVSSADYGSSSSFVGIAPDARLVNVKVGGSNGTVDVSQVLAGINWVAEHRKDNGLNIRVLNLSFGTDSTQSYLTDPLTYAAETAWRRFGIVVVTSAGNSQFGTSALNDPATDPYVLAVGSDDTQGTVGIRDDDVSDFSARGNGIRNPDLIAPGRSIVSLRDPGSFIDVNHGETGRVGARFFRGSGTSQAAAVTSGAAALLLSQRPGLSPDQVKQILTSTARRLPAADALAQGSGLVNLKDAFSAPTPGCNRCQFFPTASGTGSLEAARGSIHVGDGSTGAVLTGEQDIFGAPWDGNTWSGNTWSGNTWSGGVWNGNTWSGNTWSGNTWSGNTWSGNTWSGNTWSGNTWSGNTWSGNTWSGNTWSGNTWSGNTWSGNTWSGNTWSGNTWSGVVWDGNTWSGNTWSGNTWSGNPSGVRAIGASVSLSSDAGWGDTQWSADSWGY
jgi:serine protease AprX